MRILLTACLALFLLLANCQKKEEPRVKAPLPPVSIQTQKEITLLQDLVRQDPKNVDVWIKLGNILMDTYRFQEAIDAYQKVLELDPKNVDVRVDMGTCFRNIGRFDRAVEEYKKAISINPRHVNAHRNLGVVLAFDLGQKEQAIKELEEYLRLSPDAFDAQQIRQMIAQLKTTQ